MSTSMQTLLIYIVVSVTMAIGLVTAATFIEP
jgi:hypothetical protein